MSPLTLTLLGAPHVTLDGATLHIQRRKAVALLAYLAVTQMPHRRDALATLLWPDFDQTGARDNLRRTLSALHQALSHNWLESDRTTVCLPVQPGLWVDVAHFDQLLASVQNHHHPADQICDDCLSLLNSALQLYKGDLLAGFTLADSPDFDEWQAFETERLRLAYASVLARLGDAYRERGESAAAIDYARRWVALDPLHEPAHRQLMRLYAWSGQQAAALRQYQACVATLATELGVPPADETTALYEQILREKVQPINDHPAPAPIAPVDPKVGRRLHHNLPTQTTTFVGRERELGDIRRLLLDEAGCRLLNLVGPGGIGKTRLALVAAAHARADYSDGACFVSLTSVSDTTDLIPAIAEALGFTFFGQSEPKQQLLDYLSQKQLLLFIDNFEHLLAGVDLLSDILRHAPEVSLLVTARERLHLQEEWVYELQGLPFPTVGDEKHEGLAAYDAVQLFLQRAQQLEASFHPSVAEMADIVRICQLVAGMPLGLELAAPWIKVLSCHEIATEIERSLDILTTSLRNVPKRHRSLRVVFEQTWQRLSAAERGVLMQLSVLRGGTREAAGAVAGATLSELSSLVDKALLRRTNLGRYELHELIRQFAEMQLKRDPEAVEQTQQRHQEYFITFLEARTADVKGRRQPVTLAEIEADMDNVRLAWRRAAAMRDAVAIERAAECLFVYYLYRNGYDEGQAEFRRAVIAIADIPAEQADDGPLLGLVAPIQKQALVGYLLASLGYFVAHRHNLKQGQKLLEQAVALLRWSPPADQHKEAFSLLWLGWALYFQGQLSEGKRYASESLTLLAETPDQWAEGWALLLLGNCLRDGRPAEAVEVYQTGLTLCEESGDQIMVSYLNLNLGAATTYLGCYAQARHYLALALTINEKQDNILGLGYSLFHQGKLEIAQGQYRQACQTLQQALRYFNKVGTVHASRARIYFGWACHLLGDYDLASQHYHQALEGFKAGHSKLDLTRCLNALGCLAYDQGQLHQAEQFQRESLALLQETEIQPALVAATVGYLGQVIVASGEPRWTEARNAFRQALELAFAHQLAPLALEICVAVTQLFVQAEDRELAIDSLMLAGQHEAATVATRTTAYAKLTEMGHPVPRTVEQTPKDQTSVPDLWGTLQALLAKLTANAEAS
jgi:predicted ATPase/DNA-binding SARP family transcriptional activator